MERRKSARAITSSSSSSSRHYVQGGYDYEFAEEFDRDRFECPICLLCQNEPYQTSCGHRFCYSCILTWLREGKTCPKDNCTLGEGEKSVTNYFFLPLFSCFHYLYLFASALAMLSYLVL